MLAGRIGVAFSGVLAVGVCVAAAAAPMVHRGDDEPPAEPTLWPGDAAPALAVGEWVKGEPVAGLERGTVYVIDFWATWCAPCLAIMPRMSALADRHAGDGVVVIALTSADEDNTAEEIRRVVRERDGAMRFRVAIDDGSRTTDAFWKASGEQAIPRSFIVDREGRLAWIGHPKDAEPVVAAVLAGTWDAKAAATGRREKQRRDAEVTRVTTLSAEAYKAGDVLGRLAALEKACELDPMDLPEPDRHWPFTERIKILKTLDRTEEALAVARRCAAIESLRGDAWAQANLADVTWDLDQTLAAELADRAEALVKAEEALDEQSGGDEWDRFARRWMGRAAPYIHLAAVRFRQGRAAEAVALQKRALEWVKDSPRRVEWLRPALEEYERAAAEKAGGDGDQ
jgi:thiol-disulfide isomerase/thioredoxin